MCQVVIPTMCPTVVVFYFLSIYPSILLSIMQVDSRKLMNLMKADEWPVEMFKPQTNNSREVAVEDRCFLLVFATF